MLWESHPLNQQDKYWSSALQLCQLCYKHLAVYLSNILEHLILFLLFYVLACFVLYILVRWKSVKFQKDMQEKAHRVLIITAHPDDETMFFGPTVLRFSRDPNCTVHLLCLSTGWNYGMGTVRKAELFDACKVLGIKECNVLVQKHTKLPDSMSVSWPAEVIAKIVQNHVEALDIDTLITFDRYGVSRHVNHCSIYYAVALLSMEHKLPNSCNVYVLETINLLRKYWSIFDIPISYIISRIRFISSPGDRSLLMKAMQMHHSQLVWFRRLYMKFSRYQLINTLQKMDLSDIELDLNVDD